MRRPEAEAVHRSPARRSQPVEPPVLRPLMEGPRYWAPADLMGRMVASLHSETAADHIGVAAEGAVLRGASLAARLVRAAAGLTMERSQGHFTMVDTAHPVSFYTGGYHDRFRSVCGLLYGRD